jgi:hypothetical protein
MGEVEPAPPGQQKFAAERRHPLIQDDLPAVSRQHLGSHEPRGASANHRDAGNFPLGIRRGDCRSAFHWHREGIFLSPAPHLRSLGRHDETRAAAKPADSTPDERRDPEAEKPKEGELNENEAALPR